MALNFQNIVLVFFFIYFIKMLKKGNGTDSSPPPTITPIPPPPIVGPPNPFQQNPSAPGGGVIIDGMPNRKVNPIADSLNYLFPVVSQTTKLAFGDVLDRAAHGDYPTKKDVKTAFMDDYAYILPREFQLAYGTGGKGTAKSAFKLRYDTWFDKISDYFYF
jgi:hypothetical protein